MKTLLKTCINDQYVTRVLHFCDRETFDCSLAMALREVQSELELQYDKIAKNDGGGN